MTQRSLAARQARALRQNPGESGRVRLESVFLVRQRQPVPDGRATYCHSCHWYSPERRCRRGSGGFHDVGAVANGAYDFRPMARRFLGGTTTAGFPVRRTDPAGCGAETALRQS
jgi:hypothetical protein